MSNDASGEIVLLFEGTGILSFTIVAIRTQQRIVLLLINGMTTRFCIHAFKIEFGNKEIYDFSGQLDRLLLFLVYNSVRDILLFKLGFPEPKT